MPKFSDTEIKEKLTGLDGWSYEDGEIVKRFRFSKFADGIGFVNSIAEAADAADHHPDIDIRYTSIRVGLSSHDAGGVTERDLNLASQIDALR